MINSNADLFKWGPIDGKPLYLWPFVKAFTIFPAVYHGTWSDTIGYIQNGKCTFVLDNKRFRDNGEQVFTQYNMDTRIAKNIFKAWLKTTKKITLIESKVNKGLEKYSDQKLQKLLIEFDKVHTDFWVHGFIPELGNYGGEQLLKRKIAEFNPLNFIDIFEAISAPEKLSFFQKEELELLQIKRNYSDAKIKWHQQKYYWKRNSYGMCNILSVEFFKEELHEISQEHAQEKIAQIRGYTKGIVKKKKDAIAKYAIPNHIVTIANQLAYSVWWQDLRKKFIFIANHINDVFAKEIARRKAISVDEIYYYTIPELLSLLNDEHSKVVVLSRQNGYVMHYHELKDITYLEGLEAQNFMKQYLEIKVNFNQTEFSGTVVSKGDITAGKVKILLSPAELDKMKHGDILVAPMTSPDFIVAMKLASAIITDEGGMTSHAAIVSRELKIPCIVGTRIATKLLKDNDTVEVDTQKGIVRKIDAKKIDILTEFDKYNLVYHAERTHKTMFVASGVIEGYLRLGNDSVGYLHNALAIISDNNHIAYYLQLPYNLSAITQIVDNNCSAFISEILEPARKSYVQTRKKFDASKSLSSFKQLAVLIEIIPIVLNALGAFSALRSYIEHDELKQKKIDLLFGDVGKERNAIAHLYSEIDIAAAYCLECISNEIKVPFSELKYLSHHEAKILVDTKKINSRLRTELKKRSKPFLIINTRKKGLHFIYNQTIINYIIKKYNPSAALTSVHGKSVYPGKITGHIVNIRLHPTTSFPKDAIIIAPMTVVEDYPLLKNCLAIVTDEGGLLSHAAIIARELKKPCVIGTRNATKTFKDGDLVEVDADTGVVRKR